jgi:hypothetical protein
MTPKPPEGGLKPIFVLYLRCQKSVRLQDYKTARLEDYIARMAGPSGFCPDGGIGRRAGLKHQWQQCCAGSIPAPGTEKECE